MANVANRRAFLEASHALATSARPTGDMVTDVCEALSAVLTDLAGELTHIIPLTNDDAEYLAARDAALHQEKQQKGDG